ncbi:hypothetical protein DFH09DRAFT_1338491 [Mycena vulgaris]|nr:hypothetical protein DFH09DRAFT_1338491 [Mycena vulgaris]
MDTSTGLQLLRLSAHLRSSSTDVHLPRLQIDYLQARNARNGDATLLCAMRMSARRVTICLFSWERCIQRFLSRPAYRIQIASVLHRTHDTAILFAPFRDELAGRSRTEAPFSFCHSPSSSTLKAVAPRSLRLKLPSPSPPTGRASAYSLHLRHHPRSATQDAFLDHRDVDDDAGADTALPFPRRPSIYAARKCGQDSEIRANTQVFLPRRTY